MSKRSLETVENGIRELRRANAAPIIAAAVAEGRIAGDEQPRWLERAERLGVDVVRDLLRERRPDGRFAKPADAPVSAEQDAALATVFPGYEPRKG